VKVLLHKCVPCKRVTGRPYSRPEPPPLHSERVKDARHFEITEVNFMGALYVKKVDEDSKVCVVVYMWSDKSNTSRNSRRFICWDLHSDGLWLNDPYLVL